MNSNHTQQQIADKIGIDAKTVRSHWKEDSPPSERRKIHDWVTRRNPFEKVWDEILEFLKNTPQIQVKTIFEHLQRTYPGDFQDGQKRSLERKIKRWKAIDGPNKEVFFNQCHHPGELGASDFSHMTECGVTIMGAPFRHMIYHFVLTYSNWESVTICSSESFESLSDGFQNAMWRLGGAPTSHRTDRMSAAVKNLKGNLSEFTDRYDALMKHYHIRPEKIQAGKGHENGDVEQSHYRFKEAVKQALMLRGCKDFESEADYKTFIQKLVEQRNKGRRIRFEEELSKLKPLPSNRLDTDKYFHPKVTRNSTITINSLIYSVPSRLIGERVKIRQTDEILEVWLGSDLVELLPRNRGSNKHQINYRHVIDSLVRKPGAFENYVFREEMFPTTIFRMAYDQILENYPTKANGIYLKILYLAATESEALVNSALAQALNKGEKISLIDIENDLLEGQTHSSFLDIKVDAVDLGIYDSLIPVEVVYET